MEATSSQHPLISIARRTGAQTLDWFRFMGGIAYLCRDIASELLRPPYYWNLISEQIYFIGIRSLPLAAMTGLATGSVMALQFGYGLSRFGGTLYIPRIVALSIIRELGPVFTSLLVAGRVASGIAAEVASMKVTQQIDAIRALGTSPVKRIVIPRLAACLIALPILTLFADYVGLFGAMLVSTKELHINSEYFIAKGIETLRIYDLLTGMAKTVVFGFFIAVTSCWKGLNTEGGTQGVGNTTTWAVVVSSIFIMISDYLLTKFFILTIFPKY